MNWIGEHWITLMFFLLYTGVLVAHAWQAQRQTKGIEDYYVGGRTMGGVVIGLSFFATYSSTNSFIGMAGQAYTYGVAWLLLIPAVVAFSFLSWVVVAPRLRRFAVQLGSLTIPDFIGFRFGSTAARVIASIIVIFASLFYLTAIFKGIGNTLEAFLDIPYTLAVWVTFVIVVTYTAVGGFISVVKTDAVQGIILLLGALILSYTVVNAAGGVDSITLIRDLPEGAALFTADAAMPFLVLIGIIFASTIKFLVEPRQLARFYALGSPQAVRRGMWVSTLSFLAVYTAIVPLGLYARNLFPSGFTDTDQVIPAMLNDPEIVPPVASAFLLTGIVAAAMSSIDSVLLVMAATFHRDLVGLIRDVGSEKAALRATAGYVAVFALITTFLALNPPGGIMTLTAFSGSLYAACFFPAVIFGLYWRRGNGPAVVSSLLVGLSVLLLWKQFGLSNSVHEVFPSLIISTLAYVGVALATPVYHTAEVECCFNHRLAASSPAADLVPR